VQSRFITVLDFDHHLLKFIIVSSNVDVLLYYMFYGLLRSLNRPTHFLQFTRQIRYHAFSNGLPNTQTTPVLAALSRVLRRSNGRASTVSSLVSRAGRAQQRQRILETMFSMLTAHHHYEEATVVYDKLRAEGFVLSPLTDAKLCAIALSNLSLAPDHKQIVYSLANIFSAAAFTETDLINYIALIRGMGFTPGTCAAILKTFIATRVASFKPSSGTLRLLVGLQAQAGVVSDALDIMSQVEGNSTAYFSILDNIDPLDTESVDEVLATMRRQQVDTDAHLFNVLIIRACRSRQMHQAFHLYRYLASLSTETPVRPNVRTYRFLFALLRNSYKPTHQTPRYRRHVRDDRVIMSPRALYKDLLSVHQSLPSKNLQDQAVLAAAFKCFVAKRDYSAAYVVVKMYSTFRCQVTVAFYRFLLSHIRRKLQVELHLHMGAKRGMKTLRSMLRRRDRGHRSHWERSQMQRNLLLERVRLGHASNFPWSRRMVNQGPTRKRLKQPELDEFLMHLDAGLGAEDHSVADATVGSEPTNPSWRKDKRQRSPPRIPTHSLLAAHKTSYHCFSTIPPMRLLRRAIVAEREEMHGLFKTRREASETVSKKIKKAKAAMFNS